MDHRIRAGFDWVMREVQMPSDADREAFFMAYASVHSQGHERAARVLRTAWPAAASWHSGEAYLRSKGWRPDTELSDDEDEDSGCDLFYEGPDLMDLLFGRFIHVTNRLARDAQVREYISTQRPQWTNHIIINRDYWRDEEPCGVGRDRVVSIQEGLAMMSEPAHPHPACSCTFDPDR